MRSMVEFSKKNKRTISILTVLLGTLFIRVGFLTVYGALIGGDTDFYVNNAEQIMSNGIGFYIHNAGTAWYWGYPTFLAIIFSVFGENLFIAAAIQTILISISCILIYRLMVLLGCKEDIAIILTLFYSIIKDVNMWDCFILSDCLGMFWQCVCLFCFYRLIICKFDQRSVNWKWAFLWLISMLLFFITRANSISLILAMITILLASIEDKKVKWITISCSLIAVIVLIAIVAFAGSQTSFGLGGRWEYYKQGFINGMVVSGRTEYDVFVPSEHYGNIIFIADVILIVFKRIVMYWSIYFAEYSMVHKMFCIATILPIFILSVWSIIQIVRKKREDIILL